MDVDKANIVIGEDLYGFSINELETRIASLKIEITRLNTELEKKKRERGAADKLFGG